MINASEYSAIGRRVEERKHPKQPQGIGGQMGVLEPTQAEKDRAALWELCERLIQPLNDDRPDLEWYCLTTMPDVYISREHAVAALLESLVADVTTD